MSPIALPVLDITVCVIDGEVLSSGLVLDVLGGIDVGGTMLTRITARARERTYIVLLCSIFTRWLMMPIRGVVLSNLDPVSPYIPTCSS